MQKRRIFLKVISIFVLLIIPPFAYAQQDSPGTRKLIFFYSPTCHRCMEIKKVMMPDIEKEFRNQIKIEYLDISDIENYKLLLAFQEKYKVKFKIIIPVFYFEGRFLNGEQIAKKDITALIRKTPNTQFLKENGKLPSIDLIGMFKRFKLLAIISTGLADGINPCAFTVLVFFISFLVLQGYQKRELIIIGLSFIFAIFLTYFFIGFSLFNFLYRIEGFWLARRIFNFLIGILSIILGMFCLYDLLKFYRTGRTEGMTLQLPNSVKNQIHKIIGLHYRIDKSEQAEDRVFRKPIFKLFLSALITGFLVSILEAICTGQVYVPTIVFVLNSTRFKLAAFGYLLVYNLMFILPLLVIFIFALFGTTSEQFSQFFKRHLSVTKLLMALLFFILGIAILCAEVLPRQVARPVLVNRIATVGPFFWDFGQVKAGEVLEHTFVLKNISKKTLNINDITTSCGCTVFEVKEKILKPGGSTFIKVRFNSQGYSGPTQQRVYVQTDSLDNPILRYIIKCDVVK